MILFTFGQSKIQQSVEKYWWWVEVSFDRVFCINFDWLDSVGSLRQQNWPLEKKLE